MNVVVTILSWSDIGCQTAVVRQWLSHSGCPTVVVLQWLSHTVFVTQWLSDSGCHTVAVTQWLLHSGHKVLCVVAVPTIQH